MFSGLNNKKALSNTHQDKAKVMQISHFFEGCSIPFFCSTSESCRNTFSKDSSAGYMPVESRPCKKVPKFFLKTASLPFGFLSSQTALCSPTKKHKE